MLSVNDGCAFSEVSLRSLKRAISKWKNKKMTTPNHWLANPLFRIGNGGQ